MLFLKFLSIIAFLPAIYPLRKFIQKDEINVFDLIIIFHSVFFCLIPIISDISAFNWLDGFFFEEDIIFQVFVYYMSFIGLFLLVDFYWTKNNKYRYSIINITHYLKTTPQIEVSWLFIFFLCINLIVSWLWYLPQASYMEAFQDYSIMKGNEASPLYLFYGSIFCLCFSFSLILYIKEKLSPSKKRILLYILLGFGFLLVFMPRRTMLFYFVLATIMTYSIKRDFFSLKKIVWGTLIILFVIKIYFPFYNVMRRSAIQFDSNNITVSLVHVIEDTINSYETDKKSASEMSEGRALNLYYALYRIVKYDESPNYGGLFISAIDHALPRVINPNKGKGSEIILEKKMRCYEDQADSILLLSYADFGSFFGFLYAISLYILIINMYIFINNFSSKISRHHSTIGLILIVYLISMSWNVEGKLDGYFASYIHLIIMSVLLILLSKYTVIKYKNN